MKNSNDFDSYGSIAFENTDYLIFDKNSGVAVQSADESQLDLCGFLQSEKGGPVFPITRIDQAVSGLTLFALSKEAAATATKLLNENKIKKAYIAIVERRAMKYGLLVDLLVKRGNKAFVSSEGKMAVTNYKLLREYDRYSLLHVTIDTGRFHQIRVQLSKHGHPIKGDIKYGARRTNEYPGICLHCSELEIIQDTDSKSIKVKTDWPLSQNWEPFK
jgi:23S rRNA pseudouridine1911/1915/1917 synthase